MVDKNKWLNKIQKIKSEKNIIEYKKAEKILIGYENVKTSIKWALLYKHVKELNGFYFNEFIDEEGFSVGLLRNRIFNDRESFLNEVSKFINNGWIFEQGAYLNNVPVVENMLKREGLID